MCRRSGHIPESNIDNIVTDVSDVPDITRPGSPTTSEVMGCVCDVCLYLFWVACASNAAATFVVVHGVDGVV